MNILQIFATPIWESQLPNFSEHKNNLVEAAHAFKEMFPEGSNSNSVHNFYQSAPVLTRDPAFGFIFEYICQVGMKASFDLNFIPCNVVVTSAWLNFQDSPNGMLLDHVHNQNSVFSGVMYLEVPENSGKVSFTNPGLNPMWHGLNLLQNKNKFTSERLQIAPVEGSIFIWPSYLPHRTLPNDHNKSRISLSFNLLTLPQMHDMHQQSAAAE